MHLKSQTTSTKCDQRFPWRQFWAQHVPKLGSIIHPKSFQEEPRSQANLHLGFDARCDWILKVFSNEFRKGLGLKLEGRVDQKTDHVPSFRRFG